MEKKSLSLEDFHAIFSLVSCFLQSRDIANRLAMNSQLFFAIAAMFVLTSDAYSPPVILNTKAKGEGGKDVCSWDHVQIAPHETLNQIGKCRQLYCGHDFTITITKCFVDPSGKCEWIGTDYTQLYPDCCGIRLCT